MRDRNSTVLPRMCREERSDVDEEIHPPLPGAYVRGHAFLVYAKEREVTI